MTASQVIIVSDKDSAQKELEAQVQKNHVSKENIKIVQVKRQSSHSVPDKHEVTVSNKTESPVWVVMIISEEVE